MAKNELTVITNVEWTNIFTCRKEFEGMFADNSPKALRAMEQHLKAVLRIDDMNIISIKHFLRDFDDKRYEDTVINKARVTMILDSDYSIKDLEKMIRALFNTWVDPDDLKIYGTKKF